MHAAKSILLSLLFIQAALQTRSHNPQSLQFFSSITILKMEYRERIPKKAPTGHKRLQNILPWENARYPTSANILNEPIIEEMLT
jgi:hypothetical protein